MVWLKKNTIKCRMFGVEKGDHWDRQEFCLFTYGNPNLQRLQLSHTKCTIQHIFQQTINNELFIADWDLNATTNKNDSNYLVCTDCVGIIIWLLSVVFIIGSLTKWTPLHIQYYMFMSTLFNAKGCCCCLTNCIGSSAHVCCSPVCEQQYTQNFTRFNLFINHTKKLIVVN